MHFLEKKILDSCLFLHSDAIVTFNLISKFPVITLLAFDAFNLFKIAHIKAHSPHQSLVTPFDIKIVRLPGEVKCTTPQLIEIISYAKNPKISRTRRSAR